MIKYNIKKNIIFQKNLRILNLKLVNYNYNFKKKQ